MWALVVVCGLAWCAVPINLDSYPDLLTVLEVAAILRVDRSYVYRLIRQGRLSVLRLTPHKTRVPKKDLFSFLGTVRLRPLDSQEQPRLDRD